MGKAIVYHAYTRILRRQISCHRNRLRVFVKHYQPPFFTQLRQNQTRMPAAPKRAIHINTVFLNIQRINSFIQ